MTAPDVEYIKEKVEPVVKKYNIPKIYLFGAYARGEATDESDIDFMFDDEGSQIETLSDYYDLKKELENVLEKEVDVADIKEMKKTFLSRIVYIKKLL